MTSPALVRTTTSASNGISSSRSALQRLTGPLSGHEPLTVSVPRRSAMRTRGRRSSHCICSRTVTRGASVPMRCTSPASACTTTRSMCRATVAVCVRSCLNASLAPTATPHTPVRTSATSAISFGVEMTMCRPNVDPPGAPRRVAPAPAGYGQPHPARRRRSAPGGAEPAGAAVVAAGRQLVDHGTAGATKGTSSSWAMRSPARPANGSRPWLTSTTRSSPR